MIEKTVVVDTANHAVAGVADTSSTAVAQAAAQHGEKFEFSHLLDHMHNSRQLEFPGGHIELPQFAPIHIGSLTFDLSISKHVFFLLLSAVIVVVLAVYGARKNRKSIVPRGVGNLLEVFIVFIRDEVALPNMGPGGLKYLPFLLTLFFFILIMNLLGLIPYGATSTSNISVTAALAVIAFVMIQAAAIQSQGVKHYIAHLTGGVHWSLWPIMIPVEILGLFTKPFALCIRLFANMTAGHVVILGLISLIFILKSAWVATVSVPFTLFIFLLELLVCFIQAFIFTTLVSTFIGMSVHPAH